MAPSSATISTTLAVATPGGLSPLRAACENSKIKIGAISMCHYREGLLAVSSSPFANLCPSVDVGTGLACVVWWEGKGVHIRTRKLYISFLWDRESTMIFEGRKADIMGLRGVDNGLCAIDIFHKDNFFRDIATFREISRAADRLLTFCLPRATSIRSQGGYIRGLGNIPRGLTHVCLNR